MKPTVLILAILTLALPAPAAEPIDLDKPGTFESGAWKYVYSITGKGSKSEFRTGELTCAGKPIPGAVPDDRIDTPWGRMQLFSGDYIYTRGWLLKRTHDMPIDNAKGRLLSPTGAMIAAAPAPAPPAPDPPAPPDQPWQAVAGETKPYRDSPAAEIPVRGKLIAVNYGEPGKTYLRPPINYYVEAEGKRALLGPPMDEVFGPLKDQTVKIRGKMQAAPAGGGEPFLWVAWIRRAEDAPAAPAAETAPLSQGVRAEVRRFGDWTYELTIDPRPVRVRYAGALTYKDKPVSAENGQWLWTPWGKLTYLASRFDRGWMPHDYPEKLPEGKEIESPDPATSRRVRQRYEKFAAGLDKFTIMLRYVGPSDKPYYALELSTLPEHPATYPAFYLFAKLDQRQSRGLLDAITEQGSLAQAMDAEDLKTARVKTETGYVLRASIGGAGSPGAFGKPLEYVLSEHLGWDIEMLRRLDGLRTALDGEAAKAMDMLLARMAGHRAEWEKAASKAAAARPSGEAKDDGRQGVQGKVLKMKGNFMPGPAPGPGRPMEQGRGTRTPLAVPVYVFKGKVKPFDKPDPKHAQLVKIIQADKDGAFKLALPPGEYTVVAEIGGKMYLNIMQMSPAGAAWATVTVQEGKWTTFNVEDTADAAL